MRKPKKPKCITVIGYRWFDRVNGNTYHRARIMINGLTLYVTPYQYGYGDQYLYNSLEWLNANKYVTIGKHSNGSWNDTLWSYCEKHNINCTYWAEDVRTKRELKSM